MELGQYQLQIFVSLVVILGAAFVALICDFLKGNNEQLRELTIELRVRREEERRQSQMMTAHTISASAPALRERMRMERVEKARIEERLEVASPRAMAAPEKEKAHRRPPSSEAIAAMERGAQLAASPRRRPAPQPREAEIAGLEIASEIQPAHTMATVVTNVAGDLEESVPAVTARAASLAPQGVAIPRQITLVAKSNGSASKKDWGSLLARKAVKSLEQNVAQPTVDASQDLSGDVVPAGFHEGYILSRLVQSRRPVSGLVVSIGVNTPRKPDGSMPEAVRNLMQSLIGAGDFACQSSSEEYLLIYPNERGASAQRRLSEIAERLWDFQLSSMGSFSILFSWGGVEVHGETIDEAIESANERMQETRRGRKLLTMEPRGEQQHQFRQAV